MNALEELAESFSRLPGIGKKSANRIATHLLKADSIFLQRFAHQLTTLQERIKPCSICGAYTEVEPCEICSNPARERNLICVVEQPQDVQTIEASREYHGLFHVLGGVISPLDGIGPENLSEVMKTGVLGVGIGSGIASGREVERFTKESDFAVISERVRLYRKLLSET